MRHPLTFPDEKLQSVSLFQDVTRDHPTRGHDVRSVSTVTSQC